MKFAGFSRAAGLASVFAVLATSIFIASPASAAEVNPTSGYDVSYPQCQVGDSTMAINLPSTKAFAIVGVNGGLVFSENSCLQSQIAWAGDSLQLYANTGNRGPTSPLWPTSQTSPRVCSASNPDTANCAFNYGYNAAKDSYLRAQLAFLELGLTTSPKSVTWWLDIEEANSWRPFNGEVITDEFAFDMNVANLRGATYYLESIAKVRQVGFYSSPNAWQVITGNTLEFSAHPFWYPIGTSTEANALTQCATQPGLTGSPSLMVQYIDPDLNLDVNVPCTDFAKSVTNLVSNTRSSAYRSGYVYLKATLKTYTSAPVVNQRVTFRFAGKTYYAYTSSSGIATKKVRVPYYLKTYSIRVSYAGNNILSSDTASDSLKVVAR